jgi:hypothetical protein
MVKLLVLVGIAGAAAWAYKSYNESKAYDAVWTDATAFGDDFAAQPVDLR